MAAEAFLLESGSAQTVTEVIDRGAVGEYPPRVAFPACQIDGAKCLETRKDGPRFLRPPELAKRSEDVCQTDGPITIEGPRPPPGLNRLFVVTQLVVGTG